MSNGKLTRRDSRSGSFDAAVKQTTGKRANLYVEIMSELSRQPLTDPQLISALQRRGVNCTPSGVRSRRNELVQNDWVTEMRDGEGAPVKKRNATGSRCQVWRWVTSEDTLVNRQQKPSMSAAGAAAVKRWANWFTGDPESAEGAVNAYLHPDETNAELDKAGAPE